MKALVITASLSFCFVFCFLTEVNGHSGGRVRVAGYPGQSIDRDRFYLPAVGREPSAGCPHCVEVALPFSPSSSCRSLIYSPF